MYEAIAILVDLAKESEWETIGEALSPELHQLITKWDSLPFDKRGELAGHALGKHGGDILIPGALVKIAGKCSKSARALAAIRKKFHIANDTLVLEAVAEVGSGTKVKQLFQQGL